MPTLPFAMADLPRKPVTSAYREEAYDREIRGAAPPHSGTWSGSQSYNGYHSDRQSRYSRSSYHTASSSSSNNFRNSTSQPSPSSSSTTSTASSLRTPPDLLLNGLASSLTIPLKGVTLLDGKVKSDLLTQRSAHLSIYHLESRLELLSQLPKLPDFGHLPTPPRSPKMQVKPLTAESKKRKVDYSSSDKSDDENRQSSKRRPNTVNTDGSTSTESKRSACQLLSSEQWEPPAPRNWAKEVYFETAVAYRHRGRELKHRGDDRRRDLSTSKRLASSPEKEAIVASLEQMDALLLYTYGFWCEDQASGGNSCVVANWTSLYGLLKYVYDQLSKNKMTVLAGLCRLLEAFVRRHVGSHEMRLVSHRLSKTLASSSGNTSAQSPPSIESTQQTLMEASEAMSKIVADNERSIRMMQQSKQSILNLTVLQDSFPQIASLCEGFTKNRQWNSIEQVKLASSVDPSAGLQDIESTDSNALTTNQNGWVWPLDLSTPAPLIVCFGRAVLREAAIEAKVHFIMEPVHSL